MSVAHHAAVNLRLFAERRAVSGGGFPAPCGAVTRSRLQSASCTSASHGQGASMTKPAASVGAFPPGPMCLRKVVEHCESRCQPAHPPPSPFDRARQAGPFPDRPWGRSRRRLAAPPLRRAAAWRVFFLLLRPPPGYRIGSLDRPVGVRRAVPLRTAAAGARRRLGGRHCACPGYADARGGARRLWRPLLFNLRTAWINFLAAGGASGAGGGLPGPAACPARALFRISSS